MNEAEDKAKSEAILAVLITVVREKKQSAKPDEFIVIKTHMREVVAETCRRLKGKHTRADVLECWLLLALHGLASRIEPATVVPKAMGDA